VTTTRGTGIKAKGLSSEISKHGKEWLDLDQDSIQWGSEKCKGVKNDET